MSKSLFTIIFSLLLFLTSSASIVHADTPIITSFTSGTPQISSHQAASFSWTTQNTGSNAFIISCIDGVTYTNPNASSAPLPCGTEITVNTNDGISVVVNNFSGFSKVIYFTLKPRDGSGQGYQQLARTLSTVVSPGDPILTFLADQTTSTRNKPVALSWVLQDAPGVNISIDCPNTIQIKIPEQLNFGVLPCNRNIFDSAITATTLNLIFRNEGLFDTPVTIHLIPAITTNSFDGSHNKTVTIMVPTDKLSEPTASNFTVSPGRVGNGGTITLNWQTKNDFGVNFVFDCVQDVLVFSGSSTVPCGLNASTTSYTVGTSTSFKIKSKTMAARNLPISLLLTRLDGSNVNSGWSVIPVVIPGDEPPAPVVTPPGTNPAKKPVTSTKKKSVALAKPKVPAKMFNQTLWLGSSGPEVASLQKFLQKYPDLYPQMIVNSFYGPTTEAAVKRFQVKYKLSGPGIAGYGTVDQKTRDLLNTLTR